MIVPDLSLCLLADYQIISLDDDLVDFEINHVHNSFHDLIHTLLLEGLSWSHSSSVPIQERCYL
jgi:hypothetical protein